jgi:hypothetical protein
MPEFGADEQQLDELRHAEALLDGAFSGRAKAFLVAGEELVSAIGAFHGLSAVFDGLPQALANDELRSGAATLEEVANDCATIHDLIPEQIGGMDNLFTANGNIGKRLDQLRDNIKIVACIALNARIEASSLKSNSQDMLTFTYDVAKLATTAETTIDQYSSEQRKAHQVLQSARDVLTEFDSHHRAQLGTVAREVERNLRAVEARRTSVLDEASRIGDRSRQITASIGTIITALQIADITSQRFAHVHEAVALILEGLAANEDAGGDVWWADLSADERRSVAAQAAQLQVAQIDHTLADLNTETQSIETEISKLAGDATAMAQQGAALYGSGGDAAQSFLGELAGRIDVAGRLLSDCRKAFGRVGELNTSLGARFAALQGQAASLQGIVGVVSGVRLIGLNAHLKSDGLGHEGRTLSAISRELRSSADFITVHARDLIKAIDDTLAQFEKLQLSNRGVGAERLGALSDGMAAALAAFEQGGERLAEALTSLTCEGEKVCANLRSAAECIRRRDDLEDRLRGAREVLVRLGASAPASGDTSRAKAAAASFFGERYTMAAERNVHSAQHTGHQAGSGSAMVHAEEDLESILF